MKNHLLISMILIAVGLLMPEMLPAQKTGTTVTTREKTEAEAKAREQAELARKLQEQERQLQEQLRQEQSQLREQLRVQIDSIKGRQLVRHISSGDLDAYFYTSQGHSQGSQSRGMPRTTWDFSRTLKDNSSVKEYEFEVDKDIKSLSMSISGMSRSGEIRIAILMPGNKTYSEVVIDELGNLNWRKSFEINEDSKERIGNWKFKVTTKRATGNFRISLSAT